MKLGRYRRTYEAFIDSRPLSQVSLSAVAVYKMLEVKADDFGNIPADPVRVRNLISGRRLDLGVELIEQLCQNLEHAGCLARYEAEGDRWFHLVGWLVEQPKNKSGRRVRYYPAWPGEEAECATGQVPDMGGVHPGESGGGLGNPGESGGGLGNPGESGGTRGDLYNHKTIFRSPTTPTPPAPSSGKPRKRPAEGGGGGGGGDHGAKGGPEAAIAVLPASGACGGVSGVSRSPKPQAGINRASRQAHALSADDLVGDQLVAFGELRADGVAVMPDMALTLASAFTLTEVRHAIKMVKNSGARVPVGGAVVNTLRSGMAGTDLRARALLGAQRARRERWRLWLADERNWGEVPALFAEYRAGRPDQAGLSDGSLLKLEAFVDWAVARLFEQEVSRGRCECEHEGQDDPWRPG